MEVQASPRGSRALSPEAQLRMVACVALALAAIFGSWLGIAWLLPANADTPPPAAPADGSFVPTHDQLAGLSVKPILRRDFPAVTATRGLYRQ